MSIHKTNLLSKGGPTLTIFVLMDQERENSNTNIKGPLLAGQQNDVDPESFVRGGPILIV